MLFWLVHFCWSILVNLAFNLLVSVSGYCPESRLGVVVESFCHWLVPCSGPVGFCCCVRFV